MRLESRTLHLNGKLKELCDGMDSVVVGGNNMRTLVNGLASRFGENVKRFIIENKWQIYRDDVAKGNDIGENDVDKPLDSDDIFIFLAIEGSGRAGRIILGTVLIVAGVFLAPVNPAVGSALISTGIGLVLQGFFQPSIPESKERPDERPSFLFNGATNTSVEGSGVPLVFGRTRTGSVTVSAGVDVESRQFTAPSDPSPGGPGGSGGGSVDPRAGIRLF